MTAAFNINDKIIEIFINDVLVSSKNILYFVFLRARGPNWNEKSVIKSDKIMTLWLYFG